MRKGYVYVFFTSLFVGVSESYKSRVVITKDFDKITLGYFITQITLLFLVFSFPVYLWLAGITG